MTQSNPILGAEASDITSLRFISDGFGDQYSACIDKDIVIVGAGMAGIGAALTLLEHGCKNFVLLEGEFTRQFIPKKFWLLKTLGPKSFIANGCICI